jgi:energy-coupling factor transport system permease protein
MLKDITLGQYFPGNSPVHKLDPRTKLLLLIVYIIALFSAVSWVSYGLCLLFLVITVAVSQIPPKSLIRGMKPMIFILVFTGFLNLFFYTEGTVLVSFWGITVTTGGIVRAVFMVFRILMLVSATFMLTYTTSPIALTDGLESLLSPLKKVRLPVHELSMMMCIALRFIPTLIEETDKIISAQKARGADFESGKLMEKVKALVPILVPLFISAFRRADELATAMECRCYQGGEGRTKMKQMHYRSRDFYAFLVGAVLLAAVIALSVFGL